VADGTQPGVFLANASVQLKDLGGHTQESVPRDKVLPIVVDRMMAAARTVDSRIGGPMVLLAIEDVTERKQAEAERAALLVEARSAKEQAERANRAKDEFLATLSHELRTPLTAMLGWVRMLQSGTLDAATGARALQVIDRDTKLQAQLIDDLLDVSRIVTGKLSLELKAVDVGAVVEAALDGVAPGALAKSVTLERRIDPAAGPAWGDARRLQQVIWNLLSNAIKFTERGEVRLRIGVADPGRPFAGESLTKASQVLSFSVSDTGIGIANEKLNLIFEAFQQADGTTSRKYGGTGLGLSISRELARLLGGAIAVTSVPGAGSTFTLYLPDVLLVLDVHVRRRRQGCVRDGMTVVGFYRSAPKPRDRFLPINLCALRVGEKSVV